MSLTPSPPAFGGPAGGPPGGFGGPPGAASAYRARLRRQRRGVLATVLALVFLGICGLIVFSLVVLQVGAGAAVVGALGALLPVGPVVYAFLWLDRWEPEPPRLLLLAFLWGACFAALAALVLNSSAEAAVAQSIGLDASQTFSAIFVAPWVEEAMKGAFVLGLLIFRRREFDGVLDGVVYAGVVAAGFAFTENILYLGGAFAEGATGGGVLPVLIMRGVLSPFAHPLFTAMTGIGLGIAANSRHILIRVFAAIGGYLLAVLLHGMWNASASFGPRTLVGVYLLVMVPMFVFVAALVLFQRRREQRVIVAEMPGFAAAGWIAPSEIHLFESIAGRRNWVRRVRQLHGPEVAKMVAAYQAAVTELAVLRHRMMRGSLTGPHAEQWHDELVAEVLETRARAVGTPDALHAAWGRRQPPPGWAPPGPHQPPDPSGPPRPGQFRPGQFRPPPAYGGGNPVPPQGGPPGPGPGFPPVPPPRQSPPV